MVDRINSFNTSLIANDAKIMKKVQTEKDGKMPQ